MDAKRTENHARRGRTKCLFGCGDHSFHMFTDDVRSGDGGGGAEATAMAVTSCSVLCNPTHMVIVQLIHVTQGLEKKKKELSVGYLTPMEER